jgi:Flp pilus assembly protein TadG
MTRASGKPAQTISSRFAADRSGQIGLTFALSFLPMLMLAGTAVDYGRTVQARESLHRATDAAALALAKDVPRNPAALIESDARRLLAAASGRTPIELAGAPTLSRDRTELCVDATTSVETTFLKTAGFSAVRVAARSCASIDAGDFVIAFAFATPSSMAARGR